MIRIGLFFVFIVCLSYSRSQTLFSLIPSSKSKIDFHNRVQENYYNNVLTYDYFYNGSGVAIGDVNNDGLSDIFFAGNMTPCKLYLNQGNLQFKDTSNSLGMNMLYGQFTGVAMVDINNDGWLDIYLCKSAGYDPYSRRHQFLVNNHGNGFSEMAYTYRLDDTSYSSQAYFYDFDKDNDLDVFLLNHPESVGQAKKVTLTYNAQKELVVNIPNSKNETINRYYENQSGYFVDKTIQVGLQSYAFGLSAVIADFNSDGYGDIYMANDFNMPDFLYINNGNGTFSEKSDSFFAHYSFTSMGSDYADLDNDGYDDLIVVDMLSENNFRQKQFNQLMGYDQYDKLVKYGMKSQFVKNVVQWNQKGKGFSDIAYPLGLAHTDWSWAPLIADFDNNGHKDIYITNGYVRDINDQDFIKFHYDSVYKRLFHEPSDSEVYKMLSIIPSVKIPNYYFANQGKMNFQKNPNNSGLDMPSWSNGAAYGDLDNDGDLDIVVNNLNQEAFLFRNNSRENNSTNYIRFQLTSKYGESKTYGTRIEVATEDSMRQYMTYYPNRGYLSCHEPFIHFGIGNNKKVDIVIRRIDGRSFRIPHLKINQKHTIDIDKLENEIAITNNSNNTATIRDISSEIGVNLAHKENDFIDFKQEPLLPRRLSMQGPAIAVGDINGDGFDDFFLGGARGFEASIYTQFQNGSFQKIEQPVFLEDKKYEDVSALFLDADRDGDMDLLVVSGGNEDILTSSSHLLRLYLNRGQGNFYRADTQFFPNISISAKALAACDYNHDGYVDIFVGGRVMPGHYGRSVENYLLKNSSKGFQIGEKINLSDYGWATDATWVDMDGDGWEDLIIVGDWMPPMIWYNHRGSLSDTPTLLSSKRGWWTSVKAEDLNQDGKIDLILGNFGLNSRYQVSENNPITMYVSDYDHNGSTDILLGHYENGKHYPIPIRDLLLDQIPMLKKKFNRYIKYSNAEIKDILSSEQIAQSNKYFINDMRSYIAYNQGGQNVQMQPLPLEAQYFPIYGIHSYDIDRDGNNELLLSGNEYGVEIESGRIDAGRGCVLRRQDNQYQPIYHTGYETLGDVKSVHRITIRGEAAWIVGKNNDKIQILKVE